MLTIIRTILLEHVRNRTIWQFVGIGIIIALASVVAVSISLGQGDKIITDTRLNGIELIGLITVVMIVAQARRKARANHNIHLLVTHYHNKVTIYLSYLIAYIVLIGLLYLIMSVIAYATIILSGQTPLPGFGLAVVCSFIKMIGLTTIAWVLGSVMSGYLASIITLVIYIIGHSTGFVAYYFARQYGSSTGLLGKILYYLFPNFQALDSHPLFAGTITSLDIGVSIITMILYSIVLTRIGTMIVRRQEI